MNATLTDLQDSVARLSASTQKLLTTNAILRDGFLAQRAQLEAVKQIQPEIIPELSVEALQAIAAADAEIDALAVAVESQLVENQSVLEPAAAPVVEDQETPATPVEAQATETAAVVEEQPVEQVAATATVEEVAAEAPVAEETAAPSEEAPADAVVAEEPAAEPAAEEQAAADAAGTEEPAVDAAGTEEPSTQPTE